MVQESKSQLEPEKDTTEKSTSSAVKNFARGTVKAVAKVTALDVISKDVRRMKPHHPQLWKDLLNARSKLRDIEANKANGRQPGTPVAKAAKNAALTAIIGLAVALYGLVLISQQASPADLPWINKIGMITLVIAGLIQTTIYGLITIKLLHRNTLAQQHSSGRPRGNAS